MASLVRKKRRETKALVVGGGGINYFEKCLIPDATARHLFEFFWDDAKTFGRWIQTCHKNKKLCAQKKILMKAWWDQLQPIELPPNIRRNVFRASFSKKLDLSGDGFELAPNVYEQLASVLANVTALKELNLIGVQFRRTKKQAVKHFNFDVANMKITIP